MVKTGERIGVAVAPFASAFIVKGANLEGAKEAARRLGFNPNGGFNVDGLIPTLGHYGTFFARQKLDSKLGHTRALARNSLTAWLTELGDWVLATGGKMPTNAEGWKAVYWQYVQTQSGYSGGSHAWDAFNLTDPAGKRFMSSLGLHVGAALARKVISRTGVSRYLRMGKRAGKSLVTI